jgi:class 3 adenylate cyclase
MNLTAPTAEQDLREFHRSLRFRKELEGEFRRDFGERYAPMLRRFFALGLALYMSFAVLDYWALPIYYPTAWALRLLAGTAMLWLVFQIEKPFFKRNVVWIPSAWTLLAGVSILLMIDLAQPNESAFLFYAFGLLLIIVAIYVPSSGDLLYPSLAGWATVVAYVLIGVFRQHMLASPGLARSFFVITFFLVGMNVLCMIGGELLVVSQRRDFLLRRVIEEQRATEQHLRDQADRLLLNVLPASIADRLKRGEVVADVFQNASVLFADIANFTPFSGHLDLQQLVGVLNDVFREFDIMAARLQLQPIKTTGDGYLVVAGVPDPRPDHASVLVRLGLEMCEYFNRQTFAGEHLGLRVGISSGPVLAAVIGLQRFSYDVWGDTVNTASRMQSHGQTGAVQITDASYALVRDEYTCEPRGLIEVKGKGQMQVWRVLGPKHVAALQPGLVEGQS